MHIYKHKPKEGQSFLGEIYLFYWDLRVMRGVEVLSKIG
jgi:hypothetical protein